LAGNGLSKQTVEEVRVVKTAVEESTTDLATPYARYFPGLSNQKIPISF